MKISIFLLSTIIFIMPGYQYSIAQTMRISGKVIDANTSGPIPFTHISTPDHTQGTVCNINGGFTLSLPQGYSGKVNISSIGYESYSFTLDGRTLPYTIRLKPSKKLLNEVVISADAARQIVKKALGKIPDNYPNTPTNFEGFFRQAKRTPKHDYLYISEAMLQVHKKSYTNRNSSGQIKLLKGRKMDFHQDTLNRVKFYAGPHAPHWGDVALTRADFISNVNQYNYTLLDVTSHKEYPVYIILFSPKKGTNIQGKLYIHEQSYAFIKVEYKSLSNRIRGHDLINPYFKWHSGNFQAEYKNINNTWYLNHVWNNRLGYDKLLKDSIYSTLEYVTTKIDTVNTSEIPYSDRIQFSDIFIDQINSFDSTYWQEFNTIAQEPTMTNAIRNQQLHQQSLNLNYIVQDTIQPKEVKLSKRQKLVRFLSRLKLTYGGGITSFDRNSNTIGLNYGNESFQSNNNSSFAYGFHNSIMYAISPKVYGQLNSTITGGANQIQSYALNALYEFKALSNKRPLFIRPGIGFSYSTLRHLAGESNDPENFQKTNWKKPIELYLRSSSIGLQSYFNISIELSHRWELYTDFSYTLPLQEKHIVLAKESKGIFRSTKVLGNELDYIGFTQDGNQVYEFPVKLNLRSVSIGLLMKFGQ